MSNVKNKIKEVHIISFKQGRPVQVEPEEDV
jgi:hypothetical protein